MDVVSSIDFYSNSFTVCFVQDLHNSLVVILEKTPVLDEFDCSLLKISRTTLGSVVHDCNL